MHTGRTTQDDEGRNQGETSTHQEIAEIASKSPKLGRRPRKSLPALRGTQFCQHLDVGLPVTRTGRQ